MASYSFGALTPRIHPTAYVHPSVELLGEVEIAEEASVWPTTVLRGDCGAIMVGARSNLQDGTIAHATRGQSTAVIGVECTVGHRVTLHGCRVGDHCLVGMSSTLLDGVALGEWCFVAAGALIPPGKVFEPRSFILGAPAKRIREINSSEQDAIDRAWRTYLDLARTYRAG